MFDPEGFGVNEVDAVFCEQKNSPPFSVSVAIVFRYWQDVLKDEIIEIESPGRPSTASVDTTTAVVRLD